MHIGWRAIDPSVSTRTRRRWRARGGGVRPLECGRGYLPLARYLDERDRAAAAPSGTCLETRAHSRAVGVSTARMGPKRERRWSFVSDVQQGMARIQLSPRGHLRRERDELRLFSEGAEKVELCLFDEDGTETCVELIDVDAFVWHAYLPNIQPGQRYATAFTASNDPANGKRFNPAKQLLDPTPRPSRVRSSGGSPSSATSSATPTRSTTRTPAPHMMKGVVINPFSTGPETASQDPLLRELHLRGPRARSHPAASRGPRGVARHVRRIAHPRRHRAPEEARHHQPSS